MTSERKTFVEHKTEWGNRWPDGTIDIEYGDRCSDCGATEPGDSAERTAKFTAEVYARQGEPTPAVRRTVKTTYEYGPWIEVEV